MKRTHLLSFLCLILAAVLTVCGCVAPSVPAGTGETADRTEGGTETDAPDSPRIPVETNGIALDLQDAVARGLSAEWAVSLMKEMNIGAVHLTFLVTDLLNADGSVREDAAALYRPWMAAIRQAGIAELLLTVRGGLWKDSPVTDLFAFPYPDPETGEDAPYDQYLRFYGEQIAGLAQAYPEVTLWQTGGGYDAGEDIAHPLRAQGGFYPSERAAINADLAYAAKLALAARGLESCVVLGAFTMGTDPNGAVNFLRETYRYLTSGESPLGDRTPAQCFDAVCWKPAVSWYSFDPDQFLSGNGRLTAVMRDAGDLSSPVLLTGFGFTDHGSRIYDGQQADWLEAIGQAARSLPDVRCALYPAELFETPDENTGYQGLFRVFDDGAALGAKEKAVALCRVYGGNTDNLDKYKGDHVVYQNQTDGTNAVNGIGFAIKGADERGLDIARIMDLLQEMNVGCMRNWMNIRTLLTSPTTINSTEVEKQKQWIAMLNSRGITKIIGMSQGAFRTGSESDALAAPYRDVTAGSDYMQFLESYRQSWKTLAQTFPEIGYWEVGNETNNDPFLHPVDYTTRGTKFTAVEKAMITVDMMYYAAQGVKEANPDAVVIFPAMAPTNGFSSMQTFLERCYQYIESGNAPGGTDPDAYFDAMAWHMYYFRTSFTSENWLEGNNAVYQVMVDHGDAEKKVFLTEFGFSDGGSQEKDLEGAQAFREIFALLDRMPYIDSLYPFRAVEDETAAEWGGSIEIYYGMFRVFDTGHFGAKEKAKALCEIYGGNLSGLDRYIGDNSVYPR